MFTPVRTRSTFEEALRQIADAIRAGDLRAGDRLPSERILAAQMAISRPTLREAIKLLSDAGVLEVKPAPGGGAFVRSELVPSNLLEERSKLRISEVSGVLEARRAFEPRVAQLAGLYGTEADFEAMRRTIALQRQHANDRERCLQLDLRFHIWIARATHNSTIVAMMRFLLHQLELAWDMGLRGGPEETRWAIAIHERTLAGIVSGDPEAIDAAMDEHLSFLERIWEEESGRARLRKPPDFLLPHAQRSVLRSS
ncbi:MAG: FadR family transcriptional regulator [Gemmatimonadetes bacterium]|nr:FadR family transcriptional regulator [Gemmatimonadota bacterium]